ncbi:MAG: DUF2760 domain-containing protein [Thermodesulfovibrionales bacterium]
MPSKGKISAALFIILIVFMLVLSFFVPYLAPLTAAARAALFVVAGIVVSALLAGVVSSLIKGLPDRVPETAQMPPPARPVPPAPPAPEKRPFDESVVQMLALFQKKGRLIDFLREDLSGYDDSQVGRAVRDIHKECRAALDNHMTLGPVMNEAEGEQVTIPAGFDPSAIRLTGSVVGDPPFRGIVRHSGWRVARTSMPPLPKSQDPGIVEPAEVEVQ